MVTIANISFLISLLASMFLHSGIRSEEMRRNMLLAFSIGVFALIISIVLFSATHIVNPLPYLPAPGPY